MQEPVTINPLLVKKYNQPVPRYTSYPTVPFWSDHFAVSDWKQNFQSEFGNHNHLEGMSLYLHLPFCESLCTYCGCNKKITTNHAVEEVYLQAILKEWTLYRNLMNQTPVIRELHIGGGTPTFFSAANLKRIVNAILSRSIVHPGHEFSIEGHPCNTTGMHLKALYDIGFRRISYGVQDSDPVVQQLINRIQPFETVEHAVKLARQEGFTSINFDLIYGLPGQTLQSIERTMQKAIGLHPERIAFYSYAHVPWISKAQRLFDEHDLPDAETKLALYMRGKELLMQNGYHDIGMDHFALEHDSLYQAWKKEKLHRNFMGYTTRQTGLLLGLGVSAISDTGTAYAQNDKALNHYYEHINNETLAVSKGYLLNEEDKLFRKNILDISCKGFTVFTGEQLPQLAQYTFPLIKELAADGLVEFNDQELRVTSSGHFFIRNICSAFDLYLQRSRQELSQPMYSNAI